MSKVLSMYFQRNACILKLLSATILILLLFGMVSKSSAALVSYEPMTWDDQLNKIVRDGSALPFFLPSMLEDYADGLDFQYILDSQFINSISLSSSAVGNPQIYQHIYGFSLSDSTIAYNTTNETGHQQTFNVSEEEVIAAIGKSKKSVRVIHSVTLDGCLLLAKSAEDTTGFKNLLASFELLVTKTFTLNNGRTRTANVFKGLVELVGLKNGKVLIKTRGKIRRNDISELTIEDNLIRLDFFDVLIPYKTLVKVGDNYTLSTYINSQIITTGSGTGAEVNFGPDVEVVPDYQESGQIPEPATILLLMSGLFRLSVVRKIGHSFYKTQSV